LENNIKLALPEILLVSWTGLICFRMGGNGGQFWTRFWSYGFHKIGGISWL